MAQRRDKRAIRPISVAGKLKPGRYFLVHSDQLYSLEPVEEPMTYAPKPEPLSPMGPMEADICSLEPAPKPSYGPASRRNATTPPTGFFLDRYVY